jgi:hypothetical protein
LYTLRLGHRRILDPAAAASLGVEYDAEGAAYIGEGRSIEGRSVGRRVVVHGEESAGYGSHRARAMRMAHLGDTTEEMSEGGGEGGSESGGSGGGGEKSNRKSSRNGKSRSKSNRKGRKAEGGWLGTSDVRDDDVRDDAAAAEADDDDVEVEAKEVTTKIAAVDKSDKSKAASAAAAQNASHASSSSPPSAAAAASEDSADSLMGKFVKCFATKVGLYKLNPVDLTHSLKAPGFNP